MRTRHYSLRTEEAYLRRVRQYIVFFEKRHPADLVGAEVCAFVSHLAARRKVSASTQTQTRALSALHFLYLRPHSNCLDDSTTVVVVESYVEQ